MTAHRWQNGLPVFDERVAKSAPKLNVLDLSESRLFECTVDGNLRISAVLHEDDYAALIEYVESKKFAHAFSIAGIAFLLGCALALALSLYAR